MQYKVGKVKNYKGGVGNIVTQEKNYMFLDTDVVDDTSIKDDDIVMFIDEDKKDRAFFVKKLEENTVIENK